LIIGKDKCLLFDSGLGIGNIKEVIFSLTNLPVVVLNSHTHYDHIGGNYLFDSIIGIDSRYLNANGKGMSHEDILSFYKQAYIFSNSLLPCIPNDYFIHPFSIGQFVRDNEIIDLGSLTLEIIATPGHTPDGICLLDKKDSLLFSGDIINKGTLFLHLTESDFQEFSNSITKINSKGQNIKYIMPGHGCTEIEGSYILQLEDNIREIKAGKVISIVTNGVNFYNFSYFKYLVK
jgi:glyoxylase-like metal-dependent hydrolase (beta-lactamase superfamily II)